MPTSPRQIFVPLVLILASVLSSRSATGANDTTLRNDAYEIRLLPDRRVEVTGGGSAPQTFSPTFSVLHRVSSPGLSRRLRPEEDYAILLWQWAKQKGNTYDLFQSANVDTVSASGAAIDDNAIRWTFSDTPFFGLQATLSLPPGKADPVLTFTLDPKQESWFSVGFAGAPESDPQAVDWLWQPLIWQEKRFPELSFMTTEDMGGLPTTLFSRGGVTVAVSADPQESPFRMPTLHTARFGVAVRNARGKVQPQIFAPVLGGAGSKMKPGSAFTFRARLVVRAGNWYDAYTHIARDLFGFRDARENTTCSLNTTIENMIDFAMDDKYAGWNADLKGFDYTTDVAGTVKVVSALHPLSLAMITDSEAVFRRRAVPMTEYLMSRQKYLYAEREGIKGQSPSHLMKGPAMEVADLSAMYLLTGRGTPVFRHYVQTLYDKQRALNLDLPQEAASFQNLLALYRATGDPSALTRAESAADAYVARRIDTPQTDLSDAHPKQGGQFWTDWSPRWMMLYELYQQTGQKKYLAAAVEGARLYTQYAWFFPTPPAGDVTVNTGGEVPVLNRPFGVTHPKPIHVPEAKVPAWRVSQIGLTPEASNTYSGNQAVFLTNYAAWLLRVGHDANDAFLHDVGRWAVTGRYADYPGYCIRGVYTTVYEPRDYPYRPFDAWTYNQPYYNHVWPHIALLTDYLISDAVTRSDGNIDFPSEYAQGYVYLQSKVYGNRPGTFYGDSNVWLYLPAKMLRVDNVQLNYVAGYGNDKLYVAFTNQSQQVVHAKVTFDPTLCAINPAHAYAARTWKHNRPADPQTVRGGELTIDVDPGGITAVAVEGVRVKPKFATKLRDVGPPMSDQSYRLADTPIGPVNGMLLDFGRELTTGYVYLGATEKEVRKATLQYRTGPGDWKELADDRYPYEFSVPLSASDDHIEYRVQAVMASGKMVTTDSIELHR